MRRTADRSESDGTAGTCRRIDASLAVTLISLSRSAVALTRRLLGPTADVRRGGNRRTAPFYGFTFDERVARQPSG